MGSKLGAEQVQVQVQVAGRTGAGAQSSSAGAGGFAKSVGKIGCGFRHSHWRNSLMLCLFSYLTRPWCELRDEKNFLLPSLLVSPKVIAKSLRLLLPSSGGG